MMLKYLKQQMIPQTSLKMFPEAPVDAFTHSMRHFEIFLQLEVVMKTEFTYDGRD